MFNQDYIEELDRARSRVRKITVKSRSYTLKADPQYGLVTISVDNGAKLPSELIGSFSSFFEAERAINIHANRRPKEAAVEKKA
jgi:hypothetical protein